MEQREKLIELLDIAFLDSDDNYGIPNREQVADYLIDNGVVVLPCRCGECAYAGEVPCRDIWCTKEQCYVKPDGYCHRAKRKGGEFK